MQGLRHGSREHICNQEFQEILMSVQPPTPTSSCFSFTVCLGNTLQVAKKHLYTPSLPETSH